ncbi:MAG: molybdopterin-dependent oxidoreductase [Paracoccaceae bacterium]
MPASATRPPATGSARPSAPPPAPRISTPSSRPTWSSSSAPTRPTPTRSSPSRLKKRLRAGAKLIVIDPRRIDLVKSAHVSAAHHLALKPGTNVAVVTALAHVIVTEGLADEAFIAAQCDTESFADYRAFVSDPRHSPEATEAHTGVPAETSAPPPAPLRQAATARSTTASA